MNHWKRTLLSLSVAATMLFGTAAVSHAALAPKRIGNVDSDNYVTVADATRIQRWLVGIAQMTKLEQYLGDVDGDGSCNIMDASRIQRRLVYLDRFYKPFENDWYIEDARFYADYDSGKATTDKPVTFTAEVVQEQGINPYTYEFLVHYERWYSAYREVWQGRSEDNTFTRTFKEPGEYKVECRIYNAVDESETIQIDHFVVVEPYSLEKPVIVSTCFKDDTKYHSGYSPLYVRAEGGEAPYQYRYELSGLTDDEIRIVGWTDKDTLPVDELPDQSVLITVTARDKNGVESEPVEVWYYGIEDIPA